MTLRSFNASFVSEFKVFDHSSTWKPFLYLKACFLPAVCAGSLRSRARICNVHNKSQAGREVKQKQKMNRKLLLLFFFLLSLIALPFLFRCFKGRFWKETADFMDPCLQDLASRLQKSVLSARAPATTNTYHLAFKRWKDFAIRGGS